MFLVQMEASSSEFFPKVKKLIKISMQFQKKVVNLIAECVIYYIQFLFSFNINKP